MVEKKVIHTMRRKYKKTIVRSNLINLNKMLVKYIKKMHGTNAKVEYFEREIEVSNSLTDPAIQRLCANVEFNGHLDIGVNS